MQVMRRGILFGWVLALACGPGDPPVSGGFEERLIDGDIRHGQDLEAVDLDRDGDLDLVVALSLTDAVHVYLNPGNLEEDWERISISGPGALVAIGVAVADYDGDGDLDVAATEAFGRRGGAGTAGRLMWFENPGDVRGLWTTRPISDFVLGPTTLTAGDVDEDGRPDLLVGGNAIMLPGAERPQGGGLSWWKNEGGRFFGPFVIDNTIQDVGPIYLADRDGDSRPDIVTTGRATRELAVYRRTETATPTYAKYRISGGLGAYSGLVMPSDARDNYVVAIAHTSSTTIQSFGGSDLAGPFLRTVLGGPIGRGADDRPSLALGDFGGPATDVDLALSSGGQAGDLRLFLFDPDAPTGLNQVDIRGGYQGIISLLAVDLDADGKTDLVTTTYDFGTRDRLAFWRNLR